MKKKHIYLFIFLFLGFIDIPVTHSQVGIGNTDPRAEAILDIEDGEGDKGILIPNVHLLNLSSLSPISTSTATESLLVYNTNETTGKGFHYWSGSNWIPIKSKLSTKGMQFYSYKISPVSSPPLPNFLNPRREDKSGSYTGILNVTDFGASGLRPTSDGDGFIIRLIGFYDVQNFGEFNIHSVSDDGVRVYIDEALVLDRWVDSGSNIASAKVNLAKGKHKFEFWYYENAGGQDFRFFWGSNADGRSGDMNANDFSLD